ncbi:MAG: TIGR03643 family protein [Flavobacteriales bacterium]
MTEPTSPQQESSKQVPKLDHRAIDRIVEMAWEDRTPFDAITLQFGLTEAEVIKLMRREMKLSSFRMWRARVQGRSTKHQALRNFKLGRNRSDQQRIITLNKISKRR